VAVVGWLVWKANRKKQAAIAAATSQREAAHQQALQQSEAEKQRLEAELRRQQQAANAPPTKQDLKRTMIQGGTTAPEATSATPQLVVVTTGFQQAFLLNKPSLSIGRGPGNDVQIPDQTVSGTHARLSLQLDGTWLLEDLGSTNGTFVNGQRIQRQVVKRGDQLRLGNATASL
jgi:pSer/pThr/pTyr-binding forkhead associated (FHA) protein